MKTILYISLIFILYSCSLSRKIYYDETVFILSDILEDDFFDQYRINKKILLSVGLYSELSDQFNDVSKVSNIKLIDSLDRKNKPYVKIEEFRKGEDHLVIQIGCHSKNEEFFYMMYSTSYRKVDNQWFMEGISPFIDTTIYPQN